MLLIAKIDRLARNVAFIANLMETDVQFRACDLPEANRLLLHIMAAIAGHEDRANSQRTRGAFAEAKRQGAVLGAANEKSRNLTREAMARGAQVTKAKAADFYADVLPMIVELRDSGLSLAKVAEALTEAGHLLRSGLPWNPVQVARVLNRAT